MIFWPKIERLRAEHEELRDRADGWYDAEHDWTALTEDRDRYRRALEDIAGYYSTGGPLVIARNALAREEAPDA